MDNFNKLKCFVLFVGYERSGHTLIGSVLDAHPNIIIANEFNLMKVFSKNPNLKREYIFNRLLEYSHKQKFEQEGGRSQGYTGKDGKRKIAYKYNVPNQYQGKFIELKIIGDKHAPGTCEAYDANPNIFKELEEIIQLPIKFIHVIRNPFDNIARMGLKRADTYFKWASTVEKIRKNCPVLDVYQEKMINNPKEEIIKLCSYLEQDYTENYLKDCASIVFNKPHKTRLDRKWTAEQINYVYKRMEEFPFLEIYTFED